VPTELSIIIPVYNEEDCVLRLEAELAPVVEDVGVPTEVILVDDGSSDETFSLLAEVASRRSWCRVIRLKRNFGQTQAMAAGIDQAEGETLVCLDADLQNDPKDIPRLLQKMSEGYDIVSGWRKDRKDTFLTRRLPSICANWMISRWLGVRIHDYGCSLKAYDARIMKALHLYSDMHRFLPALASQCGARVTEITVNHRPRLYGESKYGLSRVFKVAIDLIALKLIVDFSNRPSHAFGIIGMFFVLGAFMLMPLFAWNVAVGYRVNTVLPAIMIIFMLCAVNFFVIGILGDLIVRVGNTDRTDHARSTAVELT
jgi:glycosyltransferase involved in cell wall biosynthesis